MLLTDNDRHLIVQQCVNQSATDPVSVAGFAAAYVDAKLCMHLTIRTQWSYSPSSLSQKLDLWAEMIDARNLNGFRTVPVVFRSGDIANAALPARLITRAFTNLVENVFSMTPDEAYKEFQLIHPYIDGNGRVGHLLWAVLHEEWPTTLPPEIFCPGPMTIRVGTGK